MRAAGQILVVDDETSITGALELILVERGYRVKTASTFGEAVDLLGKRGFDLVLTDLRLADCTGIDLLIRVKEDCPETEVILMTAHGSVDLTIQAIKMGAYYYLEKPFTPDHVLLLVERALEFASVRRENRTLKRTRGGEDKAFGMVGRTPKMLQIYETIRATAASDASVLIEGESGTGKELIATAFHLNSARAKGPFVRINCAAIPRDLIESELFGYKKGAFTGADRDKRGLIEAASGGTLLLDEIAEMPAHLQTKLLRVLQERKLRRLGDEREIPVEFRLVAATNRNTAQAIKEGVLRGDLYFRMSTIKITVPPLRERLDDLALFADEFVQRYSSKYKRSIRGVSQAAFAQMSHYDWPGNIRELESVIERAVLLCQGDIIGPGELPDHTRGHQEGSFRCEIPPYMTLDEIDREAIEQTLERTGGNVKKTAQMLDLHRPTLYRKLRKYGLKPQAEAEE
jgi:two-component system, NtrC family, response regulator HydG